MFPYQSGDGRLGRTLRLQASIGANLSLEVRLRKIADKQCYDQVVFTDQYVGSSFPAHTCHDTNGNVDDLSALHQR